jgi:hypothetical protein
VGGLMDVVNGAVGFFTNPKNERVRQFLSKIVR